MSVRSISAICFFSVLLGTSLVACRTPETRSLLGQSLQAPELPDDVMAKRSMALEHARTILAVHPESEEALIWVGRRTAYLGRYREAVDIYTDALLLHPDSHRLRRHRGHRYITLRQFDAAIADLQEADALSRDLPDRVEADGMPNAQGRPRSTTKGNILYHLALARYLTGDYATAALDFKRCLDLATNDDMRVAAAYWVYLSARRADEQDLASDALAVATPDMDLLENHTYHVLLLTFQDVAIEDGPPSHLDAGVDEATLSYGLAMNAALAGRDEEARDKLLSIIEETNWAAFGHIAAEADLARAPSGSILLASPDSADLPAEPVQPKK
ncbi:MAG: hypothetical protein MK116_00465 [Phycisphaerales bacterium]|nr:hypothetical protein [Phycisphaerales bacterium]